MQDAEQLADDGAGGVGAPGSELKVTAATMGKKISAPIQTMRARKSSVRSNVFIWEEY